MTDFGLDISTFPDLNPNGDWVDGGSIVAEAVGRRLLTGLGSFFYDPLLGFDLFAQINEGVTQARLFQIQALVKEESEKDERVLQAGVKATFTSESLAVRVTLSLASGPFVLNLSIDKVGSVELAIE